MGAFRPHKLCRVVLALLLAHCPTAAFSEVTVRVDDAFTHVNLSPFLQYYADESGSLSFSDIRELPGHVWQTGGESIVTFGFTRSVYWFRFSIEGEGWEPLLLSLRNPGFGSIDLYAMTGGDVQVLRTGSQSAPSNRPLRHRYPLLPLPEADASETRQTFYLRARTDGSFYMPLTLWSQAAFFDSDDSSVALNGVYFGILVVVIIYNLVAFSVMQRTALAAFVGLITSFGVYQLAVTGLAFESFWSRWPGLLEAVPIFSLTFAVLCLYALTDDVLNLAGTQSVARRAMQAIVLAAAGCVVGYAFLSFADILPVLLTMTVLFSVAVLVTGVRSGILGNRFGFYSSVGLAPLLVGHMTRAATEFNLLPASFFTEHAASTGLILMILMLSFILAAEARRPEGRRILPIAPEDDATPSQRRTADLEGMVAERTSELENALKELSQAHEILKEINTIDSVTGIKNRHYFDTIFEQEWKRASREGYAISLMILDIDHFKSVNDTYGHLAGDECLHEVANTIGGVLRRPADILARYGGEEFVVVLPYIENENALYLAEQIRKRVDLQPMQADGNELHVTISIGVSSVTPTDQDDRKDLIAAADIALYEAKNTGRNKVCNAGQLTVHEGSSAAS